MYAMASGGGEEPGLLVVKTGSKLHAKMVSKEAAAQLAVPSFRVYYPVASAGAVPFLWESQPGTPKHGSSSPADELPPLTPPPSYSYHAAAGRGRSSSRSRRRRRSGGGLLGAILPWNWSITTLRRRPSSGSGSGGGSRTTATPPACASWSSSSWSSSSSSSNASSTMSPVFTVQAADSGGHHGRAFSAAAAGDYDDDGAAETTPGFFWTERERERERCQRPEVKWCGFAAAVRNALARVVGGGKPGRR